MVSQTLPAVELLPVLATLVGTAQFPTNVSAIKMLNVVGEAAILVFRGCLCSALLVIFILFICAGD